MADDQQRAGIRRRIEDGGDDILRRGVVDLLQRRHGGRRAHAGCHQRPGLLAAGGRRHDDAVRRQGVAGHIGADPGGIAAAALDENPGAVVPAWLVAFGLGMPEQQKSAHSFGFACRKGHGLWLQIMRHTNMGVALLYDASNGWR